jgi:hypothetical protein
VSSRSRIKRGICGVLRLVPVEQPAHGFEFAGEDPGPLGTTCGPGPRPAALEALFDDDERCNDQDQVRGDGSNTDQAPER